MIEELNSSKETICKYYLSSGKTMKTLLHFVLETGFGKNLFPQYFDFI